MFTQLVFKWLCLLLFCCSLSVTDNWESSCFWTIGWTVAVICTAPVGLWETVMSIYLKNNHQDLSMMKIIFSCIPIPKPPIRVRLGWNLKATTWLISFSYSSQHSLTSRDETEPINPACVQITKLDKNVCWGFAERARRSCLHHRVHTKAYCKWRKVWLPVCVCMCDVCVRVVYVWGADCASAASCGRKQFSQLLKRCPKLSRHRRMFLTHASALFYRAPRGFTLSATLFQTWTWDKTCSGAAPDWLRRQSRLDLSASEQKSVTGSRLHQRLFAERRFRHLRVCRSKRLSLELSPRLAVFTEAHRGPMNHTWIHLTSWDTLHYIFGEFQHVYYNIRWTVSLFLNWCIV